MHPDNQEKYQKFKSLVKQKEILEEEYIKEYGKDLKDVLGDILQYLWSLKYEIKNPKYLDIIEMLNKQNLPIYEIKEKSLKKVN